MTKKKFKEIMNRVKATRDVKFDLKKPCKDCPFRQGAKFHQGVYNSLLEMHHHLEDKTLIHTCHKTDPMSDSPEGKKYKGDLQHCAGLLTMMSNDVTMLGKYQLQAMNENRWKPELMKASRVFKSYLDMVRHYCRTSGQWQASELLEDKSESADKSL